VTCKLQRSLSAFRKSGGFVCLCDQYSSDAHSKRIPTIAFDLTGLSCFRRDGEEVFHTYSTYGRGCETVGGGQYLRDLTALGRQEEWEEPKGRITGLGALAGSGKIPYPDEYKE
jgi:hypothetical protein